MLNISTVFSVANVIYNTPNIFLKFDSIDEENEELAKRVVQQFYSNNSSNAEEEDSSSQVFVPDEAKNGDINDGGTSTGAAVANIIEKNSKTRPTDEEAELHEFYMQMSNDLLYDEDKANGINGFKKEYEVELPDIGFKSNIYHNKETNEIVIAYDSTAMEGEELVKDALSDAQMLGYNLPIQYYSAKSTYDKVKEKYPDADITLTGYSLGGSLAQLVASTYEDTKAVCFEPLGTTTTIEMNGLKDNNNCINYATDKSVVSGVKMQPGCTMTLEYNGISESHANDNPVVGELLSRHDIANFYDLKNAKYKDSAAEAISRGLMEQKTSFLSSVVGAFSSSPAFTSIFGLLN